MQPSRVEEVDCLASRLLVEHGLSPRWSFAVDNAVSRAGRCCYNTQRITVSRHLAHDSKHALCIVENVLLHEIAHALAGYAAGHGPVWRDIALRIGCDGKRCHSIMIKPCTYAIACRSCLRVNSLRHRIHQPTILRTVCSYCGNKNMAAIKSLQRPAPPLFIPQ